MPEFHSLEDLHDYMLSQPFDRELSSYKSSLYPADKLLYDKNTGPCYNYILDWQTGKYEYLSEAFKMLLGYPNGFFDRGVESTFDIIHPNDTEAFYKMLSRFLGLIPEATTEEVNQYSVSYNFRVKKNNGSYLNVLQQPVYASMDRKGNIVYDAGIVIDITRYRTDGNLSLLVKGPEGRSILEYYPKEEFAPRLTAVREALGKMDKLAGQTGKRFLRRLNKVLNEHGENRKLNVGMFSRRLNISRSQLYRKIKETLDMTPTRLIRLYRLQRSLEYLARERLLISEVAYRVGFNSPSYFTRCFTREFECSPTEYRQQVR